MSTRALLKRQQERRDRREGPYTQEMLAVDLSEIQEETRKIARETMVVKIGGSIIVGFILFKSLWGN